MYIFGLMALIRRLLIFLFLMATPFVLLIRMALYLHTYYGYQAYLCIGLSILATSVLLLLYYITFHAFIFGRLLNFRMMRSRSILLLLATFGFVLYGLLIISSNNVKHSELKSEFRNTHPILRLALSTIIYLDKKLILTDAERAIQDYDKMGLSRNEKSLHLRQADGYSHAIDLRTDGRWAIRNALLETYFRLMGFHTLRHVGTGDHLHVDMR